MSQSIPWPHIQRFSSPKRVLDHPLAIVLDELLRNIDSLATSFPLVTAGLEEAVSATGHELNILATSKAVLTKESDGVRSYTVPAAIEPEFFELYRKLMQANAATAIIPQSLLVALVSQYDAFVMKLVRHLYSMQPTVLNRLEKMITIKELTTYNSIEEAKEAIITKDIDGLMRESHAEQIKEIGKRFDVSLSPKKVKAWPRFIEVTERRNLFVHTSGLVSDQYLRVCREHSSFVDDEPLLGQQLGVDASYFEQSYEAIYQIAVLLTQGLWRQVRPDEQPAAEENLTDICLWLIVQNRNQLVIQLLSYFLDTGRKFSSHDIELSTKLNLAQAHKWSDNQRACNDVLESIDWSACGDRFLLAREILYDRFDEAAKLMKRLGKDGGITDVGYRDWPIFRVFRETHQFREGFKELFDREFTGQTAEIEDDRPNS